MSELFVPAMSAVDPSTEAHDHDPRGAADPRDERRLANHTCDLLRQADDVIIQRRDSGLFRATGTQRVCESRMSV